MKNLIATMTFLFVGKTFGATCPAQLTCGTFEGPVVESAGPGSPIEQDRLREKLAITGIDEKTALVEFYLYGVGQRPEEGFFYDATMTFQNEVQFALSYQSQMVGGGFCNLSVCTVTFPPGPNSKGKTVGNVNILRFEKNKLVHTMMSSVIFEEMLITRSELTKNP